MTIAELIEQIGPARLAEAFGVSVQAISNMKQRGAIPSRHWLSTVRLAEAANISGVTIELLERLSNGPTVAPHAEQSARHPRRVAAR